MTDIIYENSRVAVLIKPAGTDSEAAPDGLLCVHRLDKAASGVMVYAKDGSAAAELSAAFSGRKTEKEYLAVVCGTPGSGRMEDLLFHDRRVNKTYVTDRERKGVKRASLSFEALASAEHEGITLSLVKIRLETGRTHQIRVQFASRGFPLAGDSRYGSTVRGCGLALWSLRIAFPAPGSGEQLCFSLLPDTAVFPWSLFARELGESG